MSEKKFCEFCGKEHDGSFGSGRFCSYSCATKYGNSNPITLDRLESGEYKFTGTSKISGWLLRHGYKENKCEICGITEWLGKPISCELHHIDGNRQNNKLSNLQMLCPNCHSQTDNFKSKKLTWLKNQAK